MPRPKTKKDLINLSKTNYDNLLSLVMQFSDERKNSEFPAPCLNRNIRDVLAHIHHWHLLLLSWYEQGAQGKKPEMPALGYTWRTVPALNIKIREKYRDVPLIEVFELLASSFGEVQELIAKHTNNELSVKQKFKWTGTTSLGAYVISATSSHYEWALKLIKKSTMSTP